MTPLAGDDWGYALNGMKGTPFSTAVEFYFSWSGRFFSELWGFLVAPNKWLWNIVNALVITSSIYLGDCFIGKNNKKFIFPLVVLIILGMNMYTFSQGVTWLAGNITYLFVVPVVLWYFYYLSTKTLF